LVSEERKVEKRTVVVEEPRVARKVYVG